MKFVKLIKADFKFIDYPDKNGSCYIPLNNGRVEIHTASGGNFTVDFKSGELADLGKGFKVFDNLNDAKQYALKLAKKYNYNIYDKF